MTRTMMIGAIFALGPAMASPAIGQPSATPAPDDRNAARPVDRKPTEPEFKVVFWYIRANPSATLKSQAYDLRRGEYDRGVVEAWKKRMSIDFPAYVVVERDISLNDKPGAADDARLAAAIQREREQIVGAHPRQVERRTVVPNRPPQAQSNQAASRTGSESRSLDLSRLLHPGGSSSVPSFSGGSMPGSGAFRGAPGSGGSSLAPSSPLFPNPYPYPRPHP